MEQQRDAETIRKVKAGEIGQYALIVNQYSKVVYSFISHKLYDKEEVDDIVQNAFIKFYKFIERFDESKPVLPYLLEIAKNEMKMYLRSKKKVYSLDERIQVSNTTELWSDAKEAENLLQYVSPEQKKALLLLSEGYSYQEVAEQLQRPLNTVKTIVRRARLILQKIVNHE